MLAVREADNICIEKIYKQIHHTDIQFQEGEIHKNHKNIKSQKKQSKR